MQLKKKFSDCLQSCLSLGLFSNDTGELTIDIEHFWVILNTHYTESHRYYHTFQHIEHCLLQLSDCAQYIKYPQEVELAIWFHDVIYVPGAKDNEQKSADLFGQLFVTILAPENLNRIKSLILSTTHNTELTTNDEKFMVDIDLSSFAASNKQYQKNNLNLRKEQLNLSDYDFNKKQLSLLNLIIKRERIFKTRFFYENLEQAARVNIKQHKIVLQQEQLKLTPSKL